MNLIDRTITHWTAGARRASAKDKQHYHQITEWDGTIVDGTESLEDNVVTSDGDYAGHTRHLNTRSGGFAMAGMHAAKEFPFDAGPYPITEKQFEAHCQNLARVHIENGLPVNRRTCLTHAEVEGTYGVKQAGKWDLTRLPHRPELRGAGPVGDYLRDRVKSYMGAMTGAAPVNNRPMLRRGDRGAFVLDLQKALADLRYHLGALDAHFGRITEASVLAFQSDQHLTTDGIVGPATWAAITQAQKAPLRDVTETDLRERNSRTIKDADKAATGAKVTGASVMGLGALDTITEAMDKLSIAAGPLDAAQAVLIDNWPILAAMGVGFVVWLKGPEIMDCIRNYRVEDAKTGANLKR